MASVPACTNTPTMARVEAIVLSLIAVSAFLAVTEALSLRPWRCGPTCAIACPCGRETDFRGCPTCTCRKCGKCELLLCHRYMKCGNGFEVFNGCPICQCKRCPPAPMCKNFCPYGYKKVDGCKSCACRDPPIVIDPPTPCGPKSICPAIFECPFGYQTDSMGCRICKCKSGPPALPPKPCPKVICPLFRHCPFGYDVDKNGCSTCHCRIAMEY